MGWSVGQPVRLSITRFFKSRIFSGNGMKLLKSQCISLTASHYKLSVRPLVHWSSGNGREITIKFKSWTINSSLIIRAFSHLVSLEISDIKLMPLFRCIHASLYGGPLFVPLSPCLLPSCPHYNSLGCWAYSLEVFIHFDLLPIT